MQPINPIPRRTIFFDPGEAIKEIRIRDLELWRNLHLAVPQGLVDWHGLSMVSFQGLDSGCISVGPLSEKLKIPFPKLAGNSPVRVFQGYYLITAPLTVYSFYDLRDHTVELSGYGNRLLITIKERILWRVAHESSW